MEQSKPPRRHERSADERGYDAAHRKLRAEWAPKVARGDVPCARCGRVIPPDAPWDLGHDDLDRSRWTGPEHQRCNRATAGRRAKAPEVRRSQEW